MEFGRRFGKVEPLSLNIGNTDLSVLGGVCDTILLTSMLVELPLFADSARAGATSVGSVTFVLVKEFAKLPLSMDTARACATSVGSVTFVLVEEFAKLPLSALDVESIVSGISMS